MKKKKKKNKLTLDSKTTERTIGTVRTAILHRLAELKKSRHWLSQQSGMRPASLYDFLSGKTATTGSDKVEVMLDVLGLEITPKRKAR